MSYYVPGMVVRISRRFSLALFFTVSVVNLLVLSTRWYQYTLYLHFTEA